MAPGEVGEGGECGVLVELFEDEFLRAGADAAVAGEDGFAARRQAFDEGEELVAIRLGEGFEIIEDEQGLTISSPATCLKSSTFRVTNGN